MTHLYVSQWYSGNNLAEQIAEQLEQDAAVTSVDLTLNVIQWEGGVRLAAALDGNISVTSFNLSWNQIGPRGAERFGKCLEQNRTLTKLGLGFNDIGDHGAKRLAAALKLNRSLTIIDLDNNSITDLGAQHLAAALHRNCTLLTVELHGNAIQDRGAEKFAECLVQNKTINRLNLGQNRIGDGGLQQFLAALNWNCSLKSLILDENFIAQAGLEMLQVALQRDASYILTTTFSPRDSERCTVTCTNLAGERVAHVEIESDANMAMLIRVIGLQLNSTAGLRLVGSDGQPLTHPHSTIREVLDARMDLDESADPDNQGSAQPHATGADGLGLAEPPDFDLGEGRDHHRHVERQYNLDWDRDQLPPSAALRCSFLFFCR